MVSLDELKRERDRLRAGREVEEAMAKEQRDKEQIKKEIWEMKHPRTMKVVKVVKTTGRGFGIMAKGAGKRIAPVAKQGLKNFAENPARAYEANSRPKKRRVVKVKKVKKKRRSSSGSGYPFESFFD